MPKLKEMSKDTFTISWISESTKELDFKQISMIIFQKYNHDSEIPIEHQVVYIMLEEFLPPLRIRIIINSLP